MRHKKSILIVTVILLSISCGSEIKKSPRPSRSNLDYKSAIVKKDTNNYTLESCYFDSINPLNLFSDEHDFRLKKLYTINERVDLLNCDSSYIEFAVFSSLYRDLDIDSLYNIVLQKKYYSNSVDYLVTPDLLETNRLPVAMVRSLYVNMMEHHDLNEENFSQLKILLEEVNKSDTMKFSYFSTFHFQILPDSFPDYK